MGSWPYTRLHVGPNRCIAISGLYIHVLDARSGKILQSTRCTTKVLCSAVDKEYGYLVTANDDKILYVWALDSLEMKSSRELPKKATAMQVMNEEQDSIIVADKFGDVFRYGLEVLPASPVQPVKGRAALTSHGNPNGTLVLGHTSIITCLSFTVDTKYIITADRDEHIRVSRYPQSYVIERYCLGHEHYVSAMAIPAFEPSTLISGGGDPYINIWDWLSGTIKCQIPIDDAVRPFLKVRDSREKRIKARKMDGMGSPRKQRKARKRGKNEGKIEEGGNMEIDCAETGPLKDEGSLLNHDTDEEQEEGAVLAISKIEAIELHGQRLILFNAIGGSALFYCSFPANFPETPLIQNFELSRPILDFEVAPNGHIFVSIDAAWPSSDSTSGQYVLALEWSQDRFQHAKEPLLLLETLNTTALQEASPSELASLDIYSGLLTLPKHAADREEVNIDHDELLSLPDTPEIGSQSENKKPMNARIAGRLKAKQALLRKRDEASQANSRSVSGDERDAKRIKLDDDN